MGQKVTKSSQSSSDESSGSGGSKKALALFNHAEAKSATVLIQGLPGSGCTTLTDTIDMGRTYSVPLQHLLPNSDEVENYDDGWSFNAWSQPPWDDSRWISSGRSGERPIWTALAIRTKAIIFVIDSTDRAKLGIDACVPTHTIAEQSQEGAEKAAQLRDEWVVDVKSFNRNRFWRISGPEREQYVEEKKKEMEQGVAHLTVKSCLQRLLSQRTLMPSLHYGSAPLLILANKQDMDGAVSPAELARFLELDQIKCRDWRIQGCSAKTGEGLPEAVEWLKHILLHPTDFTAELTELDAQQQARSALRSTHANRRYKARSVFQKYRQLTRQPDVTDDIRSEVENAKMYVKWKVLEQLINQPPTLQHTQTSVKYTPIMDMVSFSHMDESESETEWVDADLRGGASDSDGSLPSRSMSAASSTDSEGEDGVSDNGSPEPLTTSANDSDSESVDEAALAMVSKEKMLVESVKAVTADGVHLGQEVPPYSALTSAAYIINRKELKQKGKVSFFAKLIKKKNQQPASFDIDEIPFIRQATYG